MFVYIRGVRIYCSIANLCESWNMQVFQHDNVCDCADRSALCVSACLFVGGRSEG